MQTSIADRFQSLTGKLLRNSQKTAIQAEDNKHRQKSDLRNALKHLPTEKLRAIVGKMEEDLRGSVLFVSDQEVELALQSQYVDDLAITAKKTCHLERFNLEVELANEQEKQELLEATIIGQRRNLRKLEVIYNQYWWELQQRQRFSLANGYGSQIIKSTYTDEQISLWEEQEHEIKKFREKKTSRSPLLVGRSLLLGICLGIGLTILGTRLLSPTQRLANTPPSSSLAASQAPAQSVTFASVETSSVARTLQATGTVAAFEMIPVMSQATELQIQQILVDEGDFVRAGQLLIRLDDSVLQAQLTQAQASVAEAQARLAELRAGSRVEEIARAREAVRSAEAEVIQSKSDLDLARKRVERNENLEAEGAIARDRLDEILNEERNKQSTLNKAEARLRETQQQLAQVLAGPRKEEIAQAAAKLAQAKAQVQTTLAQLKDTQVIAPVSGKIAERNARIGDITSSSQRLFTIIENGRLELRVKIPETQLPLIRPGQTVEIPSDANSRLKLSGRVREIVPIVNEESRQATVEVDLPATSSLKPGMFLQASITTNTATSLTIPMGAVLPQGDGTSLVYILQADKTVKAQPVETGEILSSDRVEIISGLQIGDRVVLKGAAYLKDGDRVAVIGDR